MNNEPVVRVCASCGGQFAEGQTYCPRCGHQERAPKNIGCAIAGVVAFAVVLAIAAPCGIAPQGHADWDFSGIGRLIMAVCTIGIIALLLWIYNARKNT